MQPSRISAMRLGAMLHTCGPSADTVTRKSGETYGPLAADCELSSVPECTETLRADWRKRCPSQETRLEELEELVAGLMFGGEGQ